MEYLIEEVKNLIWICGLLFTISFVIGRIEGETARKWKLCLLALFAWPLVLGWRVGRDLCNTHYYARRTLSEMREEFDVLREKVE